MTLIRLLLFCLLCLYLCLYSYLNLHHFKLNSSKSLQISDIKTKISSLSLKIKGLEGDIITLSQTLELYKDINNLDVTGPEEHYYIVNNVVYPLYKFICEYNQIYGMNESAIDTRVAQHNDASNLTIKLKEDDSFDMNVVMSFLNQSISRTSLDYSYNILENKLRCLRVQRGTLVQSETSNSFMKPQC